MSETNQILANTIESWGLEFEASWQAVQSMCHMIAKDKGWWDTPREFGAVIALMHSELSEALEAQRAGCQVSGVIAPHNSVEEELADLAIRLMDAAEHYDLDVAGAILAKMKYNATREHRHGKSF